MEIFIKRVDRTCQEAVPLHCKVHGCSIIAPTVLHGCSVLQHQQLWRAAGQLQRVEGAASCGTDFTVKWRLRACESKILRIIWLLMTYHGVVPQGAPEAPRRNLAININKVRLFNALLPPPQACQQAAAAASSSSQPAAAAASRPAL